MKKELSMPRVADLLNQYRYGGRDDWVFHDKLSRSGYSCYFESARAGELNPFYARAVAGGILLARQATLSFAPELT